MPIYGIADHVLHGADTVNTDGTGTKGALNYRLSVPAGGSAEVRLRLSGEGKGFAGRNHEWWHLNSADVISMPAKWEYPWFAAWDLGFQCVALAHVDADFAKDQLLLMCRECYMHPDGQIPAYEWAFGDVNPPVHAWAALEVFEIDGATDFDFLERVFFKLLLNFTWWVTRKDAEGNNIFEGGFLGLDNIGPIDRSAPWRAMAAWSSRTAPRGWRCTASTCSKSP